MDILLQQIVESYLLANVSLSKLTRPSFSSLHSLVFCPFFEYNFNICALCELCLIDVIMILLLL